MATIIVNHRVKDFDAWKPYFDADRERRESFGLKDVTVGRDQNDRNNVYIIFQSNDPSKSEKMFADPGLEKVMKEAGVLNKPGVVVLE